MDPQTTWDQMLSAYEEGTFDRLEMLALALSNWLRKGGVPPTVLGHAGLGPNFERALAQAGCDFVLDLVRTRWSTSA